VLGVVLVSQLVGMALALVLAVARGETMPLPADLPWSIAGGLTGGIGIVALYRGLAVGRMGVVAPVTGVLAAVIPVVFGIAVEGLPTTMVIVGIGLAIVAVSSSRGSTTEVAAHPALAWPSCRVSRSAASASLSTRSAPVMRSGR
jgi:uncharacterized membrane protein